MLRADRDQPSSLSRAGGGQTEVRSLSDQHGELRTTLVVQGLLINFTGDVWNPPKHPLLLTTCQFTRQSSRLCGRCLLSLGSPRLTICSHSSDGLRRPRSQTLSSASLSLFLLFSYILLNCSYYDLFNCYLIFIIVSECSHSVVFQQNSPNTASFPSVLTSFLF